MRSGYLQMRHAGASARAMLIGAAANTWKVPAGEITITKGQITHAASGRRATFGDMAVAAAAEPVPKDVALKNPADFIYIGHDVARLDKTPKVDGSAIYTQDLRLPGMLTALVAHPPRFGGIVKSFDPSAAERIKSVTAVVAIDSGVAVVAENFWAAQPARS